MAAGSVSCPSVHFCVLGHESMVPFLGAGSQLEGGGITLGYFTRATCSLCALLCVLPVPCQLASLHCHSFLALSTTAAPRVSPPLVLPPHSQGPGMGLPSGLPFHQLLPAQCFLAATACGAGWGGCHFQLCQLPLLFFFSFSSFFCGLTAWLSLASDE